MTFVTAWRTGAAAVHQVMGRDPRNVEHAHIHSTHSMTHMLHMPHYVGRHVELCS